MTRAFAPLALILIGGCAYYNGLYNAKAASNAGDQLAAHGDIYASAQKYMESATKAETVLARHPHSHWRPLALYYASRGAALGGECARGQRRLDEYFALKSEPADRRDRATVARAACVMSSYPWLADTLLRGLLDNASSGVRAEALLWDGRVALAIGDADRAEQLLSKVPGTTASWEFMKAAFQSGNLARAESILVVRATAGDYRSEVPLRVRALWDAGHHDAVAHITDLYGRSRAPTQMRVDLRFLVSDLAAAAGDTALARRQAVDAMRLGLSPTIDAEAYARQLALRIRELEALPDIEAAIGRDSVRARGTPLLRRIKDDVTLIHLLIGNTDIAGASVFLAAELARDSLHAYKLAHAMFRSVERDFPDYEIAARALLAARSMFPESTKVYEARILQKWDSSSAAFTLQGLDLANSRQHQEDAALMRAWTFVMNQWSDTVKARRAADSIAALNAARKQ